MHSAKSADFNVMYNVQHESHRQTNAEFLHEALIFMEMSNFSQFVLKMKINRKK